MSHLRLTCVALVLCAASACQREKPGHGVMDFRSQKDGKGTAVVSFGNDAITDEQLRQRLLEMSPIARTRYQTTEQRKEYAEGLARFEVLAAEALKRGLHNDPEVIHTAKQVMVQKLLQKEFDEKSNPVPDSEVAEYYEKHKSDYVKPEMVRLSHLFIAKMEGDAAMNTKRKARAQELATQAQKQTAMDFAAFGKLVREFSEEKRTQPLDGDMRFLTDEELGQQYGQEVAVAAKALKQVGEVSPVVETAQGFHILKLQGRQAALNLALDQVKTQLQNRILFERRTQNFAKFIEDLKSKSKYAVKEDVIAKVEVDLKAPTAEQKGPPPGFIPAPITGQTAAVPR